jgi:ORF6N domain
MPKQLAITTVEGRIYLVRGRKIILDRTLADLYGVPTKALNQAVKRNIQRFPEEF